MHILLITFLKRVCRHGRQTYMQPVFNHYKAVTYISAYFSKVEHETSEAMKQAVKYATNRKS